MSHLHILDYLQLFRFFGMLLITHALIARYLTLKNLPEPQLECRKVSALEQYLYALSWSRLVLPVGPLYKF